MVRPASQLNMKFRPSLLVMESKETGKNRFSACGRFSNQKDMLPYKMALAVQLMVRLNPWSRKKYRSRSNRLAVPN